MHLLLWKQWTLVSRMASLPTGLASASGARWRWGGRWVGGRWFGRRPRGLAKLGLQLAHEGLQLFDLGTLGLHDIQQTEQGYLHHFGRLGPVLSSNT
jgi:hypothetical protein